jgi:hypothetical protein
MAAKKEGQMTKAELMEQLRDVPDEAPIVLWGRKDQFRKLENADRVAINSGRATTETTAVLLS